MYDTSHDNLPLENQFGDGLLGKSLTPEVSGIYSTTWNDGMFGLSASASYQERNMGVNTAAYRVKVVVLAAPVLDDVLADLTGLLGVHVGQADEALHDRPQLLNDQLLQIRIDDRRGARHRLVQGLALAATTIGKHIQSALEKGEK